MASPTRYSRSKDFTEDTGATTDNADINTELDAVQQTLDDIIDNMALIQRDDGELLNRKVGWDQLAEAVVLSLGKAETWAADTVYTANKTVIYGDAWHRAIDPHTSGATFAGDAAHWDQLIDFAAWATAAAASAAAASTSETNAGTSETTATAAAVAAAADAATANLAVGVAVRSETASAGQTAFTTPTYTVGTEMLLVFVNGALSRAYTESSTTSITFTSAMAGGEKVVILRSKRLTTAATESTNVAHGGGLASDYLDRHEGHTLAQLRAIASPQADKAYRVICADGTYDDAYYDSTGTDPDKDSNPDALGGGNWRRTSVLAGYINVKKVFGLTSGGVADNQSKHQDAVNEAARLGIGTYIGNGDFSHDGPVYFHYDVTNNPEFPTGNYKGGRMIVRGEGCGNRRDREQSEVNGTVLIFTHATSDGLVMGDGTNNGAKSLIATRLSVRGSTTGALIKMDYCPQYSGLEKILTDNQGAGKHIHAKSLWSSFFRDIDMWGNSGGLVSGSTGLFFDNSSGTTGGGQILIENVTGSYLDIAAQFGNAYNAANTALDMFIIRGLQGRYSNKGARFLHKFNGSIDGLWGEYNFKCDAEFSNSVGRVNMDNFHLVSGLGTFDRTNYEASIVLGQSSGTDDEKSWGGLRLRNGIMAGYGAATTKEEGCAIRKHKFSGAPVLDIDQTDIQYNNGFGILADTGDHGGISLGRDVEFSSYSLSSALRVGTGTVSSPTNAWEMVRGEGALSKLYTGTVTADLTALWRLPEIVRCATTGGTVTVNLPTDAANFVGWGRPVTFPKYQTTNQITFDAGTGNTIRGAQTYAFAAGAAYKSITVIPTETGGNFRWDVVQET